MCNPCSVTCKRVNPRYFKTLNALKCTTSSDKKNHRQKFRLLSQFYLFILQEARKLRYKNQRHIQEGSGYGRQKDDAFQQQCNIFLIILESRSNHSMSLPGIRSTIALTALSLESMRLKLLLYLWTVVDHFLQSVAFE